MKYQMELGIRGKADAAELKKLAEDKASSAVVNELVKRLNKLEEKVKFELADGDKASLSGSEGESGSEEGAQHHPNAIKEEDEEHDSESEKPKQKRRPQSGQQKANASPSKVPS